jgi:ubiquitin-conjugating enzyme (huntingtin interacting protein 2)
VAKHFLSDRASFDATAKHWAQAYAQAPAHKQKQVPGKVATDAELAGLSEAHVVAFTDMGFPRNKVVRRNRSSWFPQRDFGVGGGLWNRSRC